ncbi:5290_t:CDS:2 [Entrophospora sp. SA101]|nr:5290_t:CDS:2 [Entrophospora sp. SA101]
MVNNTPSGQNNNNNDNDATTSTGNINELLKRITSMNQQDYAAKEKTFDNTHPININANSTQPTPSFPSQTINNPITQQLNQPNLIHSPNNNNQNTMNSTNTPVVVANNNVARNLINQQNHTASYVRPALNNQLNSRSMIIPTPNLPIHTQRQRTVVQPPQQQSTNNNINNVSIPQQTQPSVKQSKEFAVARDVIRELDAKTREKRVIAHEVTNLSDNEKAKIREKFESLKPMFYNADKILPYLYHHTKSHTGTQKFIVLKYMIDDQLKALPGKYLFSLKQADDLMTQFSKYFEFVEDAKKGVKRELNTNNFMPASVQSIPPIANKSMSLTLPNKKRGLENEQEDKSSGSHENLNKKRRSEIHITDRNEIKNNNSENINNNNNSIDFGHDNPPKDYDKEPSFEEIFETIRNLWNTTKDMDTGKAAKGSEESHLPCSTHVAISPGLVCIGKALSKSA